MYEILRDHLKGTSYADKLISAEPVINALRGRKTAVELERIRKAVEITDEIYKRTFDFIKVGMTEIEIGGAVLGLMPEAGIRRLLGAALPDPERGRGVPRAEVYLVVDDPEAYHRRALDAGARELVIEARESAAGVGLFADDGTLAAGLADRFAEAFGLSTVVFEAPDKASQFALLSHFGPNVLLANVRLEEVLRVETFRWGLHADSFDPSEGGGGSAQCEDGRDR